MDWEAPVDAWYVWIGVSIVSLAIAGVVLGLPTGPPPDADGATNTIEETTASTYEASSTYEHDADAISIDGKSVAMRNEHGTARSSITYGQVVPVNGDERLERLVYGEDFESVFEEELEDPDEDAAAVFMDHVADADENNSGEWLTAADKLTVRQLAVEPNALADIHVEIDSYSSEEYEHDVNHYVRHIKMPEGISIDTEGYERFGGSTAVDYTVDGRVIPGAGYASYATHTDNRLSEDLRFDFTHHDGSREDSDSWGGYYPLDVTAEYAGQTCEQTIYSWDEEIDICAQETTADERAAELDWIELNDETEAYHVTLVVV